MQAHEQNVCPFTSIQVPGMAHDGAVSPFGANCIVDAVNGASL